MRGFLKQHNFDSSLVERRVLNAVPSEYHVIVSPLQYGLPAGGGDVTMVDCRHSHLSFLD